MYSMYLQYLCVSHVLMKVTGPVYYPLSIPVSNCFTAMKRVVVMTFCFYDMNIRFLVSYMTLN